MYKTKFSLVLFALLGIALLQCQRNDSLCPVFDGSIGGCGDFIVYRYGCDNRMGMAIMGDINVLAITEEPKVFDLAGTSGLLARIEEFAVPGPGHYCNDVLMARALRVWSATEGTATVWISQPKDEGLYRVTVILQNAVFEDGSSNPIRVDELKFENVLVGWLAG